MKTILEKKFELALGFNKPPLSQLIKDEGSGSFFGMNAVLYFYQLISTLSGTSAMNCGCWNSVDTWSPR